MNIIMNRIDDIIYTGLHVAQLKYDNIVQLYNKIADNAGLDKMAGLNMSAIAVDKTSSDIQELTEMIKVLNDAYENMLDISVTDNDKLNDGILMQVDKIVQQQNVAKGGADIRKTAKKLNETMDFLRSFSQSLREAKDILRTHIGNDFNRSTQATETGHYDKIVDKFRLPYERGETIKHVNIAGTLKKYDFDGSDVNEILRDIVLKDHHKADLGDRLTRNERADHDTVEEINQSIQSIQMQTTRTKPIHMRELLCKKYFEHDFQMPLFNIIDFTNILSMNENSMIRDEIKSKGLSALLFMPEIVECFDNNSVSASSLPTLFTDEELKQYQHEFGRNYKVYEKIKSSGYILTRTMITSMDDHKTMLQNISKKFSATTDTSMVATKLQYLCKLYNCYSSYEKWIPQQSGGGNNVIEALKNFAMSFTQEMHIEQFETNNNNKASHSEIKNALQHMCITVNFLNKIKKWEGISGDQLKYINLELKYAISYPKFCKAKKEFEKAAEMKKAPIYTIRKLANICEAIDGEIQSKYFTSLPYIMISINLDHDPVDILDMMLIINFELTLQ